METRQGARNLVLLASLLCMFIAVAYGRQSGNNGKKEFVFHGKVEKIDLAGKTLTVNGEKVEGWMESMTMLYTVDKTDVLKTIKVGDQITAKVYDGDFKVLHDVKVIPETKAPAAAPKK